MPRAWSRKDERQYEHIKAGERREQGRSEKVAKRIAAATVNKQRAKEGRTKQKTSASKSGVGSSKRRSSR